MVVRTGNDCRISDNVVGVVTIPSGGSGYTTAPSVTISGPGIGTAATVLLLRSAVEALFPMFMSPMLVLVILLHLQLLLVSLYGGYRNLENNETITGSSNGVTAVGRHGMQYLVK